MAYWEQNYYVRTRWHATGTAKRFYPLDAAVRRHAEAKPVSINCAVGSIGTHRICRDLRSQKTPSESVVSLFLFRFLPGLSEGSTDRGGASEEFCHRPVICIRGAEEHGSSMVSTSKNRAAALDSPFGFHREFNYTSSLKCMLWRIPYAQPKAIQMTCRSYHSPCFEEKGQHEVGCNRHRQRFYPPDAAGHRHATVCKHPSTPPHQPATARNSQPYEGPESVENSIGQSRQPIGAQVPC